MTGKLTGRDSGRIILWYIDTSNSYIRDTGYLDHGKFQFKGVVNQPSYAHLLGSKKNGNYANFYLGYGSQSIYLEENKFLSLKMYGSKTQDENAILDKVRNRIDNQIDSIDERYSKITSQLDSATDALVKKTSETKLKRLEILRQNLVNRKEKLRIQFIRNHPNSYVSPTELLGLEMSGTPLNPVESLYAGLSPAIKNSVAGKLVLNAIEAKKSYRVGKAFPSFHADDFQGNKITLEQFRGKYLLIDIWASWCVPCRRAIPTLKETYKEYHDRGFEVLALSQDKQEDKWKEAIKADATSQWCHVRFNKEIGDIFHSIATIPQQLLLDPNGKVIWSSFEGMPNRWEDVLKSALERNSTTANTR